MHTVLSKSYILITFLSLLLGGQSVFAKKMYRWIDEQGNVRYSDQYSPDQAKHRRESLNEKAKVIGVTEKEKTKAQLELEKRLKRLRKQQEEIINKQKAHDKVLRSTFRNIDDMRMALNGKMLALDGQRNVVQGNKERLEKQLQQQQKQAAQYERDGRKVPGKILAEISRSKEQIALAEDEVSRHLEKKKRARAEFEADIARFSFLTQSNSESRDLSRKTAENKAENELGLYICQTIEQCDEAWSTARQFVSTYSTTGLEVETDKLIMSLAPYKDTDLSLSVSKMDLDNNKKQIFLDIRCRKSSFGAELCQSAKAKKIRQSFSGYIKSALGGFSE